MPDVLFLADNSPTQGLGHIKRCLPLAAAFSDYEVQCTFATVGLLPRTLVEAEGHNAIELPRNTGNLPKADILIADNYRLELSDFKKLKQLCRLLIVIDDCSNRPICCDIHINHNLFANSIDHSSVQASLRLLGPKYALIDKRFPRTRNSQSGGGILISFGGTENGFMAASVAEHIRNSGLCYPIHLIVAPTLRPHRDAIAVAKHDPTVTLHHNADMPLVMEKCWLYIGAAGHTTLEAASAGLSLITVVLADNQHPNADSLHKMGETVFFDFDPAGIVGAVTSQLKKPQLSNLGKQLDGQGPQRIVKIALSTFAAYYTAGVVN